MVSMRSHYFIGSSAARRRSEARKARTVALGAPRAKQREHALFVDQPVGAGPQRGRPVSVAAPSAGEAGQDVVRVVVAVHKRVGVLAAGDVRDQHLLRRDAGVGWDLVDQRVEVGVPQPVGAVDVDAQRQEPAQPVFCWNTGPSWYTSPASPPPWPPARRAGWRGRRPRRRRTGRGAPRRGSASAGSRRRRGRGSWSSRRCTGSRAA